MDLGADENKEKEVERETVPAAQGEEGETRKRKALYLDTTDMESGQATVNIEEIEFGRNPRRVLGKVRLLRWNSVTKVCKL